MAARRQRRIPSTRRLRAEIELKIDEARRAIEEASAAMPLDAGDRAAKERILASLDELRRRAREVLGEGK